MSEEPSCRTRSQKRALEREPEPDSKKPRMEKGIPGIPGIPGIIPGAELGPQAENKFPTDPGAAKIPGMLKSGDGKGAGKSELGDGPVDMSTARGDSRRDQLRDRDPGRDQLRDPGRDQDQDQDPDPDPDPLRDQRVPSPDVIVLSDNEPSSPRVNGLGRIPEPEPGHEGLLRSPEQRERLIKQLQEELRLEEAKLVLLKKLRQSQSQKETPAPKLPPGPSGSAAAAPPPLVRGPQAPPAGKASLQVTVLQPHSQLWDPPSPAPGGPGLSQAGPPAEPPNRHAPPGPRGPANPHAAAALGLGASPPAAGPSCLGALGAAAGPENHPAGPDPSGQRAQCQPARQHPPGIPHVPEGLGCPLSPGWHCSLGCQLPGWHGRGPGQPAGRCQAGPAEAAGEDAAGDPPTQTTRPRDEFPAQRRQQRVHLPGGAGGGGAEPAGEPREGGGGRVLPRALPVRSVPHGLHVPLAGGEERHHHVRDLHGLQPEEGPEGRAHEQAQGRLRQGPAAGAGDRAEDPAANGSSRAAQGRARGAAPRAQAEFQPDVPRCWCFQRGPALLQPLSQNPELLPGRPARKTRREVGHQGQHGGLEEKSHQHRWGPALRQPRPGRAQVGLGGGAAARVSPGHDPAPLHPTVGHLEITPQGQLSQPLPPFHFYFYFHFWVFFLPQLRGTCFKNPSWINAPRLF